jgi:hypothetical protein
MIFNIDKIIKLKQQLYPKGRAFVFDEKSYLYAFHKAIAEVLKNGYNDAKSILDSILPDNDRFSELDASQWERRLGLISNPNVSLSDRKKAILRKWQHPGQIAPRQHRLFIENQLQLAGFNVRVFENRFYDGLGNIVSLNVDDFLWLQHGTFEHGEYEHNQFNGNYEVIANYIDELRDATFDTGADLFSTFFITNDNFGTIDNFGVTIPTTGINIDDIRVDVLEVRKKEFRQLLLKLKPTQTVGYLFVNYV